MSDKESKSNEPRIPVTNNPQRFEETLRFVKESLPPPAKILDLGPPNKMGELLINAGYEVHNTRTDLDINPEEVKEFKVDAVTAFEIFEHMVSPFWVIHHLPADKLFASVPLSIWFDKAHTNKEDPWDNHFHEFEDWQFDWLLNKAGWDIHRSEKWTNPAKKFGIRPLLRLFTYRYYIVEAQRKS